MKKFLAILLAVAMIASIAVIANAGNATFDYTGYKAGVTVIEDANSPTGYTAVFVYDAKNADLQALGLKDIASVTLYSDCMKLYTYEEQTAGKIDGAFGHMPEEYTEGMYPAGGSGATRLDVKLTDCGNGIFGCTIPLSSGAFVYNYTFADSEGTVKSRMDDPANPAAVNSVTKVRDLSSMVYVPFNKDKGNKDAWADRSIENPSDKAEKGTYITTCYTGANHKNHGLALYLPAGYDANREEPYKVVYISHGTGGDLYGEEMRWFNEGAVCNIMDNLGKDWIVVGMNNQEFAVSGAGQPDWDYNAIADDQLNYIMPFIEANYNVSTKKEDRAYCGLSMGGATTSNFLIYNDVFGYYGIWSYANYECENYCQVKGIETKENQDRVAKTDAKVMIAYGSWDFGMNPCKTFGKTLESIGVKYTELEVPAAHDWENWQLVYGWAAQNFLFQ